MIFSVAKKLKELALYERSKDLLEHQLKFRAKTPEDVFAVFNLILLRVRWADETKGIKGGLYLDFKVEGHDLYIRYMHLSELTHNFFSELEITKGMDLTSGGRV